MQMLRAGVFGLILTLAPADGSEASERLSRAQLLKLFPGVYSGVTRKGLKVRIQGHADGIIRGIADAKHDHGRWSVVGNKLCIQWRHWMGAKKRCGHIVRNGPWYVAVKDNGKARMKFRR